MNEVFNHVYEFFSRYYDKGDFISKRRYGGKEKYYVPYNGEEVVLHWANKDQYYVKTAEYFRNYSFRAGAYKISFLLREAEEEMNNVVGESKYFVLCDSDAVGIDEEKKNVNIYFEWRALVEDEKRKFGTRNVQETLVTDAVDRIFSETSGSRVGSELRVKVDEEKTVIEKHLNSYAKRNTTDYFIHKNLKVFLERELEFYIKNEVVDLDELENFDEKSLRIARAKVKAIREISKKIIEFLAQIEDFQKVLFEKKKFIIETEYVTTLDKIKEYAGEEFLESIVDEVLKNTKQLEEWKELLGVEIRSKKDLIQKRTVHSEEWKKLPIDTKHFGEEFKLKLLQAITMEHDLEDLLNGLVLKSENFQALNLLLEKYRGKVKCVYIDPPYNTGTDEFLYKDNYQHSSWLSMMNDRLSLAWELMTYDGVLFTHIDENEQFRLRLLLEDTFGPDNYIAPLVWPSRAGRGGTVAKIQIGHEYIECVAKDKQRSNFKPTEKEIETGNYSDEKGVYRRELLRQWGAQAQRRENRPSMYFPIPTPYGVDAYPKLPDGSDGRWRFGLKKVMKMLDEGDLDFARDEKTDEIVVYRKIRLGKKTISAPSNILDDVGSSADGTKEILSLFGEKVFDTCKPLKLVERLIELVTWEEKFPVFVLDFFAGSGTAAHAVIDMNKRDGACRRFVLVDMADFVDSITIARLKKVAYSFDWKDGKPQSTNSFGIFFKYHYVEQYEDTLNNIVLREKDKTIQETLDSFQDYFFRYMLDYETRESTTRLNIEQFKTPFDYKITVTSAGEKRLVTVDLIETFNYLLGITVEKFRTFKDNDREYRVVFGKKKDENIAIIWRNTKDIDVKKDKEFIENTILAGTKPDRIFINGDTLVEKAEPIEPEFKRLMGA
jgi:adenine-specific DNA-methyltransferase